MYYKVVIMEIKEEYILAMKQDGEIIRIKKKDGMQVGDTIYALEEDLYYKKDEKIIPFMKKTEKWKKVAVVAAVFLLIFTSAFLYGDLGISYAMISLDGEKNVQLYINKNGTIKKAISVNETVTKEELQGLKGKNIKEVEENWEKHSPNQMKWIVGFAFTKDSTMQEMNDWKIIVENKLGKENICWFYGGQEDIKEAEKSNKSLGIYLIQKGLEKDQVELFLSDMRKDEFLKLFINHPAIQEVNDVRTKMKAELEKSERDSLNEADDDLEERDDDEAFDDDQKDDDEAFDDDQKDDDEAFDDDDQKDDDDENDDFKEDEKDANDEFETDDVNEDNDEEDFDDYDNFEEKDDLEGGKEDSSDDDEDLEHINEKEDQELLDEQEEDDEKEIDD